MKIAQTRFWIDCYAGEIGIRSSNPQGQPFECSLRRRPSFLDFNFYEEDDDQSEVRLSFRLLWLSVNVRIANAKPFDEDGRRWGWHFVDRSFVFNWAKRRWSWDLPFITTRHVKTEILSLSRNRVVYTEPKKCAFLSAEYAKRTKASDENSGVFDYTYELETGEKQHVKATIYAERHHRVRKWTPFRSITDSISVRFSEEVGPERGSYKGGCLGCGYTIQGKETARQCLRRMERDRRFER